MNKIQWKRYIVPPTQWIYVRENIYNGDDDLKQAISYNKYIQLINTGNAFWINSYQYVIGYILASNTEIFRPIFNYERGKHVYNFQKKLVSLIKKRRESQRKNAYIELMRGKKHLPEVLVKMIVDIAY
jgi:hypothetical protein